MIFHKDGCIRLGIDELLCFLHGDDAVAILIHRRHGKRRLLGEGLLGNTQKDQADGGELHGNLELVEVEVEVEVEEENRMECQWIDLRGD